MRRRDDLFLPLIYSPIPRLIIQENFADGLESFAFDLWFDLSGGNGR